MPFANYKYNAKSTVKEMTTKTRLENYFKCKCPDGKKSGEGGLFHRVPVDCQTTKKQREQLFQDIYDLIKGGKFEAIAKKNIRKFIKGKNLEWDGIENTITLGKYFVIKLVD